MQIHELTKGPRKPKATNEGLLNTLKSAVSAAKTGYDAVKGTTGSTLGGAGTALGTFGRAVTDGGFGAQADWDANAKAGMDKYNALKKKYGWTDKNDEKAAAAASTAGQPDIAKAAQDLTAEFQATDLFKDITGASGQQTQADPTTVAQQDSQTPFVEPGQQLTVPPEVSGYPGSYTVDATGTWRTEDNKRITDQPTIAKLNTFANQGQDSGKIKPKAVATPQPQGKGKGGAAALNKSATAAAATAPQAKQPAQPAAASPMSEAASNARKARRAAAGITKPAAQPAQTQAQAPAAQGQQPTAPAAQAQAPAADPSIVQKIEQDPKLKPLFDKFGKEFGVTPDEVKARPEVKQALAGLLKVINSKAPAGKDQRVAKAFKSYATVVLTAMKAEGTGEDTDGDGVPDNQAAGQDQQASSATNPVIQQAATNKLVAQGLDKPTIEKVKQVAQKDPTPVKQALGLQERLNLELKRLKHTKLNEDQVRITKDIIVPTNAGNYVKKASDQQWYAPNGVMIDSEKYAEYIKKLDATPQAQTRYQADQAGPGGGSDTSFKKAQQAPQPQAPQQQATQQPAKSPVNTNPPPASNPPPPGTPQPDPMAEMLKQQQIQQFLRNRDVSIINGLVKDTTEQLRNAEIFNTGQQDYLKQQLAQMIALKV